MKIVELEKTVKEMSEKIIVLEYKVNKLESEENYVNKIKQTEQRVEVHKKVWNKTENSNDLAQKKSAQKKAKSSVFIFGTEARKKVSNAIECQEKKKSFK